MRNTAKSAAEVTETACTPWLQQSQFILRTVINNYKAHFDAAPHFSCSNSELSWTLTFPGLPHAAVGDDSADGHGSTQEEDDAALQARELLPLLQRGEKCEKEP